MELVKITQAHLEHARIPPRFWNTLLKKIPDSMSYKKDVKTYLAHFDEFWDKAIGLYLWSTENSTGKTSIATLVQKRAMQLKYSTLFLTSEDFKNAMIEKRMFSDTETLYERACKVDILVLDDLAKEYRPGNREGQAKGFAETKIEGILRYRTQALKVTVFTGNHHPKELKNIYSPDLAEMLRASMKPIEVTGKNWRAEEEKDINRMFKELGED